MRKKSLRKRLWLELQLQEQNDTGKSFKRTECSNAGQQKQTDHGRSIRDNKIMRGCMKNDSRIMGRVEEAGTERLLEEL